MKTMVNTWGKREMPQKEYLIFYQSRKLVEGAGRMRERRMQAMSRGRKVRGREEGMGTGGKKGKQEGVMKEG